MTLLNLPWLDGLRRRYRDRGFCIFRQALQRDAVDALSAMVSDLIMPYTGPILRQNGQLATNEYFPDTTLIANPLLNAHLPISEAMRPLEQALTNLVTSPEVAACLRQLDGAEHYNIHQTLVFFAAQTTEVHLDSWGLDTAPHGFAHTLWIPLQNVDYRSGLPCVIPWPLGKVLTEADLGLPGEGSVGERYARYQRAFSERLLAGSPEVTTAPLHVGDFFVWTSLTPHFTLPSYPWPTSRLSLQVLLRPLHLRWGNFLDQPSEHPTNRHIRVNERFSFFVPETISRDYQIAGSLPAPAP